MPTAEAMRSICGGWRRPARVGGGGWGDWRGLWGIWRLNAGVQRRSARFAPERWIAAVRSSRSSAGEMAGVAVGFHRSWLGRAGSRRMSWRTGELRAARASRRAVPSIPEAPERRYRGAGGAVLTGLM